MSSVQQIAVKFAIESGTFWIFGFADRFPLMTPPWSSLKINKASQNKKERIVFIRLSPLHLSSGPSQPLLGIRRPGRTTAIPRGTCRVRLPGLCERGGGSTHLMMTGCVRLRILSIMCFMLHNINRILS